MQEESKFVSIPLTDITTSSSRYRYDPAEDLKRQSLASKREDDRKKQRLLWVFIAFLAFAVIITMLIIKYV